MARLMCSRCGFTVDLGERYYYKCPRCGSPLDLEYECRWEPRGKGLHRYSSMLPFKPLKSFGEGNTPLVVDKYMGYKVWFKLEYLNPSGSFKDRGSLLAVDHAYRLGFKRVVEDTSGNTGVSVALYSSLYGLESLIVMPRDAPRGKKILVKLLGGRILEVRNRGDAGRVAEEHISSDTYYIAHTWNPLYVIGASTISFEVFEDKGVPDTIVLPVGSGGLFLGVMRGFEKLRDLGLIDDVPRPIIVEGVEVSPVYNRLHREVVEGRSNLADGIMVPNPPRLDEIIDVLEKYRGEIILVDNKDIIEAWRKILRKGYLVEPTSATPIAALEKLINNKRIERDEKILIILTGSGLKTLDLAEKYLLETRGPGPA